MERKNKIKMLVHSVNRIQIVHSDTADEGGILK